MSKFLFLFLFEGLCWTQGFIGRRGLGLGLDNKQFNQCLNCMKYFCLFNTYNPSCFITDEIPRHVGLLYNQNFGALTRLNYSASLCFAEPFTSVSPTHILVLKTFINVRLILLNPRSFKIELKSYVNKRLGFYRNLGVQSSGDHLTGLN